jgi:hypothetical protein
MMRQQSTDKHNFSHAAFFAVIFAAAFLLNVAWEVGHSLLYDWNPVISDYIPLIVLMAAKDAAWVVIFYLVAATALRDLFWVEKNNTTGFCIMALCGFVFSVAIELHAHETGRWYYNELMPVIPLLGVGLTPVLQMTLLSPFTAWSAWGFFCSLVKKNIS